MTHKQRLQAIRKLIESDIAFEADCYSLKKNKDKHAEMFADLLMEIYMVAHPSKRCPHKGWDENTKKLLNKK